MKRLLWGLTIPLMLAVLLSATSFACNNGCTPGYWKQSQHFDKWPLPYNPDTPFCQVFECAGAEGTPATLLDGLKARGGGINAFARHAVAALLNGGAMGCDFGGASGVIGMVDGLFDAGYTRGQMENMKNLFEAENEGTCPLD